MANPLRGGWGSNAHRDVALERCRMGYHLESHSCPVQSMYLVVIGFFRLRSRDCLSAGATNAAPYVNITCSRLCPSAIITYGRSPMG
jgi:hypothetical protein